MRHERAAAIDVRSPRQAVHVPAAAREIKRKPTSFATMKALRAGIGQLIGDQKERLGRGAEAIGQRAEGCGHRRHLHLDLVPGLG